MSNYVANQLVMFGAEAIFTAVLVLFLFRLRSRLGLSPLYVALGVFQPIQVLLASSIYVEIRPGLMISPGSVIMFTASLFAILLVYIREDAIEARKVIYGIMVANLTMTMLFLVFGAHMDFPGTLNFLGLPRAIFNQGGRVMFAGTLALFGDVLLVIFVFEAVRRFIPRVVFPRIYLTMAIILTFDTLVFATGAFYGQPNYGPIVLSGIVGKVGIAIFYSAVMALYLRLVEPVDRVSSTVVRPFRDIFHALTYREKYEIERNRADESRRTSEEKFGTIFDSVNDAIFVYDLDKGEILDANQRVSEMLGYSHEETLKLSVVDLSSSEPGYTRADVMDWVKKTRGGQTRIFDWHCKKKNGQFFWAEVNMRLASIGGKERVLVVAHDITERKKSEEALRQRARESAALNTVGTMVSRTLSVAQVISEAVQGVLGATQASAAFLLMRQGDDLNPVQLVFSEPGREFAEFPTHKLGQCLCGMAVSERRAIYSTDIFNDMRCTWEECKQAGLHSAAALPLFHGDDIIAVLGLGADTVRDFEAQAEFLGTLAGQVANGLQNALLYQEISRNAAELEQRVTERTAELAHKNAELEHFNKLFIDREFRIKELRDQVARLHKRT